VNYFLKIISRAYITKNIKVLRGFRKFGNWVFLKKIGKVKVKEKVI